MNGWRPEIPNRQEQIEDTPARRERFSSKAQNAALTGVLLVGLGFAVYGSLKAGAIDLAIGTFKTSADVSREVTEASQAPKVVKPLAKEVGETTVGATGGKIREGIETVVEKELGPSKEYYRAQVQDNLLNQEDQGFSSGVGQLVVSLIEHQLGVKPEDRPKDFDIIFDPETSNRGTEEYIQALDEFRQELKIGVDDFAETIVDLGSGHTDKEGAEILEIFVKSRKLGKPVEEIAPGFEQRVRDYYQRVRGLDWR